MSGALRGLVTFGRAIKLSHSVFALPFALSAAALAAREGARPVQFLWIVVAMVAARTAAMGFNRLVDHELDARNPRTARRELPRGLLRRTEVWVLVGLSAVLFVVAAGRLNRLCLLLSPVALVVLFGYSYTKRFTSLSHLVLGLALGLAPVGAWLALRGTLAAPALLIGLAVVAWVAGFDILYACQDVTFDREMGLHSIPARLGVREALLVARGLHVVAALALAAVPLTTPLHAVYFVGIAFVAALLVYEHSLVSADDLSRLDAAFFAVNGWVSLGYLVVTVAAVWLEGRGV